MKWWVGLLALLVLLIFGSLGFFYFRTYVEKRPHGVILFVANGLDLSLLQKARQQALARGQPLQIDKLNQLVMLEVKGLDQAVPDEAAASTALACGKRVRNGLVSLTVQGQHLDTLIYAAQRAGRATGLVTTNSVTGDTPLAFYGQRDGQRDDSLKNAAELIDSSEIDVVLGGGAQSFTAAHVLNERGRTDGRDLLKEAEKRGYNVVHNGQDLDQIVAWRTRRMLGLFAPDQFTFSALRLGATSLPTLAAMTRQAIRCLQYNIGGYFLVVDHSLVTTAARNNWTQLALNEASALDSAVATALEYAGPKSLILVTNNFSLGALDGARDELQTASSGTASAATSYDWLTGPGGFPMTAADRARLALLMRSGVFSSQPSAPTFPAAAVRFAETAEVTSAPAWVAAGGVRSERFHGFYANTDLFSLLKDQF